MSDGRVPTAPARTIVAESKAERITADGSNPEHQPDRAGIFALTVSPVLPSYWRRVASSYPGDADRVEAFLAPQITLMERGFRDGRGVLAWLGLFVAAIVLWPMRIMLQKAGQHVMLGSTPGSRLRRSGMALWRTIIATLLHAIVGVIIVGGFRTAGLISRPWEPIASAFIQATIIGGLIVAIGGALLQREQPNWRLLQIDDPTAHQMHPWTIAAATIAAISIVLRAFIEASRVSNTAANVGGLVEACIDLALATAILIAISRIRLKNLNDSTVQLNGESVQTVIAVIVLAAWLSVITAIISVIFGYTTLPLILSRFILWFPVVIASLYVVHITIDDLCTEFIVGTSRLGKTLHNAFGLSRSLVDQIGVLLSAVLRVIAIVIATGVAFFPFGANLNGLLDRAVILSRGGTIGQITIDPAAIFTAVAVLIIGLYSARVVQTWLVERYLPATELDGAARNSISTVARYIGLILVSLWALAALGIGFQRIGLILSALSVGIGFGLQAITQNFVSGLILLIERPIKIGDLIRFGDEEGDVKRISVRATEIEVGDRSTMIVPNSELITKAIRNVTHANPVGRVQLRFAVPVSVEVEKVPPLVLALFEKAGTVLQDPQPRVYIDSLADARVHFLCVAFVRSQRAVYETRSDLLLRLIPALRDAGISIEASPTTILRLDRGSANFEEKDIG